MKKIFFSAALLMGFAAVSFAGNPKGDAKVEVASPGSTTTGAGSTYYWFDVSANGNSLLDPSGIPLSQDPTEAGDCQGSSDEYCQRGYTEAQTTISGGKRVINVPVTASAAEDRK